MTSPSRSPKKSEIISKSRTSNLETPTVNIKRQTLNGYLYQSKYGEEYTRKSTPVETKQTYLIQWEDIIQDMNIGMVFFIGLIQVKCPESKTAKLDKDILKSINFKDFWERKEFSLCEYLAVKHKEIGRTDVTYEFAVECYNEIMGIISNDPDGMIFKVSPKLNFIRAILGIYLDKHATKIIIVLDEIWCLNCKDIPPYLASILFPKDNNNPTEILLDYRTGSMHDYVMDMIKSGKSISDYVIVTTDPDILIASRTDSNLMNNTYIVPKCTFLGIDQELMCDLSRNNYTNEYILYKQSTL